MRPRAGAISSQCTVPTRPAPTLMPRPSPDHPLGAASGRDEIEKFVIHAILILAIPGGLDGQLHLGIRARIEALLLRRHERDGGWIDGAVAKRHEEDDLALRDLRRGNEFINVLARRITLRHDPDAVAKDALV